MQRARFIGILGGVAFALHLIWENVQAPLYAEHTLSWHNFFICFLGTVGDVGITVAVFVFLLVVKSFYWDTLTRQDYTVLIVLGFFIAVLIEQNALLLQAWSYTEAMPLIPYVRVGLTPVLQMTVLLPLTFFVTQRLYAKS
jgi:hypothetical protein